VRGKPLVLTSMLVAMLAFAPAATAQDQPSEQQAPASSSGGTEFGAPVDKPTVPGTRARLLRDGTAAAPANAPREVQEAVWAANEIVGKPYLYGGGHNPRFSSRGYDCSGTVSYALRGAGLLSAPMHSGRLMRWGRAGRGKWITVYTNPGHAFVVIAGLRLDTSAAGDRRNVGRGPRWRPALRSTRGFRARTAPGF
jgi:cell wall-associated NlpC family hydrolase